MSICIPGSACIASLRCTEPDPGPVAMTSTGTNHGYGPVMLQGKSRVRENGKRRQWTVVCKGVVDQGLAALEVGSGGGAGSSGTGNVSLGLAATQARG